MLEGVKPSAVLVPLLWRAGEAHLLLTRRSETVSSHKGQISFPGGRHEPGDPDLATTALRECEEEVGVSDVALLGPLDDIFTIGGVRITPYLGVIGHDHPYRTDPREVAAVLEVPLAAFLSPGLPRVERFTGPTGEPRDVYFYDVAGEVVWGATARIIKEWLALAERWKAPPFDARG